MYLIDETYFKREYTVPNIDELQSEDGVNLGMFIDDKVRLLLQEALGTTLFISLDGDITDGVLDVGAEQRWKDFVNGVTYIDGGETLVWKGLTYVNGAYKKSLLTPYVYYNWLKYQFSYMSGVGEVSAKAKNAFNVSSNQRLTMVWNEFVEQYQGGCERSPEFRIIRNVPYIDWLGGESESNYVSMIKFLEDNSETYPDAPLKRYKFKNQLGL